MAINTILAHLSVRDLSISEPWFEILFGRPADTRPMPGLVEWLHGDQAGLQLFEDSTKAGHGTLTLLVTGLSAMSVRLDAAGLKVNEIESATAVDLIRLHDPDGNLVVLAEPKHA